MIAQRQNGETPLKYRGQKGLTWPKWDAYDWLFKDCVLYLGD